MSRALSASERETRIVRLPPASQEGVISLEESVAGRRSVRRYAAEPLTLSQLSQLLWAAQGLTSGTGLRAAPSAGATYPMEVFVLAGESSVEGLAAAIYHYRADTHSMKVHAPHDARAALAEAALGQGFVARAPAVIALCATYERTSRTYGPRANRYVHMEAGHIGENISLQAVALGLATVMVGAFEDDAVADVLGLPRDVRPLYIIPVGRPR